MKGVLAIRHPFRLDLIFPVIVLAGTEQIRCKACPASSPVYASFDGAAGDILRPCADLLETHAAATTSSNLYVILGGSLGTAAFVAIVICCVRFFLADNAARARRRRRRREQLDEDHHGGDEQRRLATANIPNL